MMAAIAAAGRGKSVVVVEPASGLGGIVDGGIRVWQDCKYPGDIGGLTKRMLGRDKQFAGGGHEMQYKFRQLFAELAEEHGMKVLLECRPGTVEKDGDRISRLLNDCNAKERPGKDE